MNKAPEMPQMKRSIWDYLFYTSLLVITIWLILKVIGIIQTPVWLEYGVPIGSAVITFLTFYQGLIDKLFDMNGKLYHMQNKIDILGANDVRMEEHLKHIDKDVEILKTDVGGLKSRTRC